MKFAKYQALGNDYIVLGELAPPLSAEIVRRICDRHYGVGSDGLLLGPLPAQDADFGLRLFNPDGSEFEKSGNGLRIFARYLWDCGFAGEAPFSVSTPGGRVTCRVHPGGRLVTVEMGRVSFHSREIPVLGPAREVLDEPLQIEGMEFRFCAAALGNPHCVLLREAASEQEARLWGPFIEREARFPNRTNVQFLQVLDRQNLRIEIWERGAGYTLASGSSACAAAAAAHRLGLCEAEVTVHMPGGALHVSLSPDFRATLSGPVVKICAGELAQELADE